MQNRDFAAGMLLLANMALPMFATPARADTAPQTAAPGGTIIVTARHRAEDVQTVPAGITVVGGELLIKAYAVNIAQVTQLVPTLNYSSPNPRNTAYTIRGLGSSVVAISQANDGLEPGVGFYVDGIYHARPATAAFDLTDIQQVEVLRGPQGTLFGKNTTAGAINITIKQPGFTLGGEAELSYGERNFTQAKAAVTGAVVPDLLAFRLSGAMTRRDGVIDNVVYNKWQNNLHNDALRGQLLFTPAANFSLRLIGDWSNFHSECCTQVYVRVAPTLKLAAQQYASLAAYAPPSTNPYDRLTSVDAGVGTNTQEGGASATAEWNAGAANLTAITAWRFWDWDAGNDRDYTGLPIQITQHIPSRQDQFTQEIRVASNGHRRLEYVAGVYGLYQKLTGHPISIYGPDATYWLLPASATRKASLLDGYASDGTTVFTTTSVAIFGEATWHVTPRLAVTGGLRYTYENKDGSYALRTYGGVAGTAALIADQASILQAQAYTASVSDGSASGRVNLAYDVTKTIMAYASYGRGQKSGGINMSGLPTYKATDVGHVVGDPILSTAVVRPEKNTTIEAGLKTRLFGNALTFNIDGFYVKVTDYQSNVVDNAAVVALRSYLANIPQVTVRGVEFDAAARIGAHVTLRASGAYSDGKYASYPQGPCPIELTGSSTASCDLTGKGLPGLPKWSGSLGGEYAAPLALGSFHGEAFARADISAKTSIYGDATDSAYTVIPGYALVNASVGYRMAQWEVAVFVRNMLGKDYLQNVTVQAGNSGLIVGTPSDPRMFGATLRAHY